MEKTAAFLLHSIYAVGLWSRWISSREMKTILILNMEIYLLAIMSSSNNYLTAITVLCTVV